MRVEETPAADVPTEDTQTEDRPKGMRFWGPLLALSIATFIVVLDTTMMTVAVPQIAEDLNTTVSGVQGGIALFAMVMASLMLFAGKVADLKGNKRLFIIGVGIYGVGTTVAALAPSLGILILGWSFLEGIAAAFILPLTFTMTFAHYRGTHRALAFGVLGGLQAVGAAVGPILGGLLTTFSTWRLGFGIELIGVFAIIPLLRYLRETEPDRTGTLDWVGAVLSVLMTLSIVVGILLAPDFGLVFPRRPFLVGGIQINPLGLSPSIWLIFFGLVLVAAFFHWQTRRERNNKTPLFTAGLLNNRGFIRSVATNAIFMIAMMGFIFTIPVFLQSFRGFSAFETGVALVPFSISAMVFSFLTPRLSARFHPKYLILGGLALAGIGILLTWAVISPALALADLVLPGLFFGVGTGLLLGPIVNLILSYVRQRQRNEASSARNANTQLGTSLGTAVVGSLLLVGFFVAVVDAVAEEAGVTLTPQEREQLAIALEDALKKLSNQEIQDIIGALPPDDQALVLQIFETAGVNAMRSAMLATVAFIVLAFVVGLFIPGGKFAPVEE
ncbi:MAG: MFS transporter [Thermoplasmata archaeon]